MPIPQIAYDQIEERVKKFKTLAKRERDEYNEDNTRKDFVLPLFRALEWNIMDASEVAAEEKISRGFVDFSFRLNGIRKFLLETKRVGEDLDKPVWMRQAIDYAYHKGVTWAVLSDFEGLKILNAEVKEAEPQHAVFKKFSFEEYLTRLEELWLLSRPAMLEGTLDREAERNFKKSIKTPISSVLFDSLRTWRDELYANLIVYNSQKLYTPKMIEEAVQKILDRLIFIRTAEDREMEGDKLIALVRELRDSNRLNDLIPTLNRRFRDLDKVYNSNLFSSHLSEDLDYQPTTLVKIIEGLYESRANAVSYNFAFIDADVLGRVYEQYLGYSVSERKKVEGEKEAEQARKTKRKSQGIYYTPTFVVKYIVQQTLGRWLDEHGAGAARNVRVLDPACGSGSFLIEAFETLDQFLARESGQAHGDYQIQDAMRQRQILEENIYGVDKDEQAVEVAQLNLLLKALHVREKLPMLKHISKGDSLTDEVWKNNFSKVIHDSGFDIIIGNPPYVRGRSLDNELKEYFANSYDTVLPNSDLYVAFLERAFKLLRENGILGFIIPRSYLTESYAERSRLQFLREAQILEVVDFSGIKVFEDATVSNIVLIVRKTQNTNNSIAVRHWQSETMIQLTTEAVEAMPDKSIRLELTGANQEILEKVRRASILLDDLCYVSYSVAAHSEVENKKKDAYIFKRKVNRKCKRFIEAREIARYTINYLGRWLQYDPKIVRRPGLPELFDTEKIMVRDVVGNQGLICSIYATGLYADYSVVCLTLKSNLQSVKTRKLEWSQSEIDLAKQYSLHYLVGVMNSSLLNFIFRVAIGGGLHVYPDNLRQLPIRGINFSDATEKKQHDAIVALVNEMLGLQKDFAEAERNKEDRRHALSARIAQIDAAIDAACNQLYGLTEEEIGIVEGNSSQNP